MKLIQGGVPTELFSEEEVAGLCGVTPGSVRKWVSRRPEYAADIEIVMGKRTIRCWTVNGLAALRRAYR